VLRATAIDSLNLTNSLTSLRIGYDESLRTTRQQLRVQRLQAIQAQFQSATAGSPQRTIFSAGNSQTIPGTQVLTEGGTPPSDPAVNEAYTYFGDTYNFYWQVFDRDSIDDQGEPLIGVVHYGQSYDNAYWDGKEMIFGDGDNQEFNRFTIPLDVIGHELTHGVTANEAGLIYWGESGALNESMSDVMGSLVKQYTNNQTVDQADWLIGEGLFTPQVLGVAIRSLKAPGTAYGYPVPDPVLGTDPQPSNVSAYVVTAQDNGGVHTNSGIPNHAFYLAAMALGGNAWDTMGIVWYQTLKSPALSKTATFQEFANLTVQTATALFPTGPAAQAIANGWAQVGVNVS
jgi:Zn-dependent metalloprotease